MPAARSVLALLAAVLGLATLVGCAGAPALQETTAAPPARTLAQVVPAADPRSLTGPTTAMLVDSRVEPIDVAPRPVLPVTVTDMQGTSVTVTAADRILALDVHGTLARTVFELGLGDRVVGRDVSSDFTEIVDRPLVTRSGHQLDGEAILALAPTVVLTDSSLGPWDVVLQLRDAGIPVVVLDPARSVAGVVPLIDQVAAALGVPDAGARLAERTRARLDDALDRIAAVAPADPADRLRVVFLYVRGQSGVYYLFGQGSGVDSLVEALGAVDVTAEIGWTGMRPVTAEGLVAAAPDVVLTTTKGLASVGGVDGLLERVPAVAQTPAGQSRRIVDMADTEVLGFGPDLPAVLDALAVALYAPAGAS